MTSKSCDAQTVYELSGASVHGPRGVIIDGLHCTLRDRATTVLLGPSGTGKSALLRALSGRPAPDGWRYSGTWMHRGVPLRASDAERGAQDIAIVKQRAHRYAPRRSEPLPASWRDALATGAKTLLLDEPAVGLVANTDADELVAALAAHARGGASIVVTHNLNLARRVADEVCLFVAGKLVEQASAERFFEQPKTELGARFLKQGNCWPTGGGGVPQLPSHFNWVIAGQLAGMGVPGLLGRMEDDLAALNAAGIVLLVSLTEEPLPPELVRGYGLQSRHFPITDMGVPGIGPTARLCNQIARALERGEGVAVHCRAGLGRTGTILAAVLVWLGRDAETAIREVRAVGRGYIQNNAQLSFVRRFAEHY